MLWEACSSVPVYRRWRHYRTAGRGGHARPPASAAENCGHTHQLRLILGKSSSIASSIVQRLVGSGGFFANGHNACRTYGSEVRCCACFGAGVGIAKGARIIRMSRVSRTRGKEAPGVLVKCCSRCFAVWSSSTSGCTGCYLRCPPAGAAPTIIIISANTHAEKLSFTSIFSHRQLRFQKSSAKIKHQLVPARFLPLRKAFYLKRQTLKSVPTCLAKIHALHKDAVSKPQPCISNDPTSPMTK